MYSQIFSRLEIEKRRFALLSKSDIFKRAKLSAEYKSLKKQRTVLLKNKANKNNDSSLHQFLQSVIQNILPKQNNALPISRNIPRNISIPTINKQHSFLNKSNESISIVNYRKVTMKKSYSLNNIKLYDNGDTIDYTDKTSRVTSMKNIRNFLHKGTIIRNVKYIKQKEMKKESKLIGDIFSLS